MRTATKEQACFPLQQTEGPKVLRKRKCMMFQEDRVVVMFCLLLVLPLVSASVAGIPQPSFLDSPVEFSGTEGGHVVLPCAVNNLGTRKVAWRKGDVIISIGAHTFTADPSYRVLTSNNGERSDFNLWISDLQMVDAGLYECQISSRDPDFSRHVQLTVTERTRPRFLDTPVNITGRVGEDVVLPCAVNNLGPKTIYWKHKNSNFPIAMGQYVYINDPKFHVMDREDGEMSEFNLLISGVQRNYTGTYVCGISSKENLVRNVHLTVVDTDDDQERDHLDVGGLIT